MRSKLIRSFSILVMGITISRCAVCEEQHIDRVLNGIFNTVVVDAICADMPKDTCEMKVCVMDIKQDTLITALQKYSSVDFTSVIPEQAEHHSKKFTKYTGDAIEAQLVYTPARYLTKDEEQVNFVNLMQSEAGQTFLREGEDSPNCNRSCADAQAMISEFLSSIAPEMTYDFEIYPFILDDKSNGGYVVFAHAVWGQLTGCKIRNDSVNQGEIEFRIDNSGIYYMRGNVNWQVEEENKVPEILNVSSVADALLKNIDLLGGIIEPEARIVEIRPVYYRALTLPVSRRILMPAYAIYFTCENDMMEKEAVCCIDATTGQIIQINDPFDQNG